MDKEEVIYESQTILTIDLIVGIIFDTIIIAAFFFFFIMFIKHSAPIITFIILIIFFVVFYSVCLFKYFKKTTYNIKNKQIPIIKMIPEGIYIYDSIEGAFFSGVPFKKCVFIPWIEIEKINYYLSGGPGHGGTLWIKPYKSYIQATTKEKLETIAEKIKYFLDRSFLTNKRWRVFSLQHAAPTNIKKRITNYMNRYSKPFL